MITTDKALLFTDGRYHNQAEIELGSEWTLMKQGTDRYCLLLFMMNSVIGWDKVGLGWIGLGWVRLG